jgi:hypothetical protein
MSWILSPDQRLPKRDVSGSSQRRARRSNRHTMADEVYILHRRGGMKLIRAILGLRSCQFRTANKMRDDGDSIVVQAEQSQWVPKSSMTSASDHAEF